MEIIEISTLDFILDEKLFYEHIKMGERSKRSIPIDRILSLAKDIPKPKILYGVLEAKIIDEEHFSLEDIVFCSKKGVETIKQFNYVIPNIVTAGSEIEEYCISMEKLLDQYITMELCNFSCDYAQQAMDRDLKSRYNIIKKTCIYPGEDDFLFESGKKIFNLFEDVKDKIGVSITETGALNPTRTAYSLCFGD